MNTRRPGPGACIVLSSIAKAVKILESRWIRLLSTTKSICRQRGGMETKTPLEFLAAAFPPERVMLASRMGILWKIETHVHGGSVR